MTGRRPDAGRNRPSKVDAREAASSADIEAAHVLQYSRFMQELPMRLAFQDEARRLGDVLATVGVDSYARFSDLVKDLEAGGADAAVLTGLWHVPPEWLSDLAHRRWSALEVSRVPVVALAVALGLRWSDFRRLALADCPADFSDAETAAALAELEAAWQTFLQD